MPRLSLSSLEPNLKPLNLTCDDIHPLLLHLGSVGRVVRGIVRGGGGGGSGGGGGGSGGCGGGGGGGVRGGVGDAVGHGLAVPGVVDFVQVVGEVLGGGSGGGGGGLVVGGRGGGGGGVGWGAPPVLRPQLCPRLVCRAAGRAHIICKDKAE